MCRLHANGSTQMFPYFLDRLIRTPCYVRIQQNDLVTALVAFSISKVVGQQPGELAATEAMG